MERFFLELLLDRCRKRLRDILVSNLYDKPSCRASLRAYHRSIKRSRDLPSEQATDSLTSHFKNRDPKIFKSERSTILGCNFKNRASKFKFDFKKCEQIQNKHPLCTLVSYTACVLLPYFTACNLGGGSSLGCLLTPTFASAALVVLKILPSAGDVLLQCFCSNSAMSPSTSSASSASASDSSASAVSPSIDLVALVTLIFP